MLVSWKTIIISLGLCLTITGNDSIEVSWTMNEELTYRCSINNENPTMCEYIK